MVNKKIQTQSKQDRSSAQYPHPAFRLRHTLKGHANTVYKMALSPDGGFLASPSEDSTVMIWDLDNGKQLRKIKHYSAQVCAAWSSDGTTLAVGGRKNKSLHLWATKTWQVRGILIGYTGIAHQIAWSPDGNFLAASSEDSRILIIDAKKGQALRELKGHAKAVLDLAWSPDGELLCSGSWDGTVKIWKVDTGKVVQSLSGHTEYVNSVAWSPNGLHIASGSDDKTVQIWNSETGQQQYILEGHTSKVISVSFIDSGRLLATQDRNGLVIFWEANIWREVARINLKCDNYYPNIIATHPSLPVIASTSKKNQEIDVWEIDFALLNIAETAMPSIFYVNAKAVLLGDSGVGKSGLGIRIAEGVFRNTESTHGAQFWHFPLEHYATVPKNIQAELTLWDLAGQPEYRLTHQLFLDDMDVALLLFDCSDPNDPFRGVHYWAKVLTKQAPAHAKKYLVSARCDVSPVTVHRREINQIVAAYGLDEYFRTSAKEGDGIESIVLHLMSDISWDKLPRTSTPKLFQVVREFLMESKATGKNMINMHDVHKAAKLRYTERAATESELHTVVHLLQSRGVVHRLDSRPGESWVLLKPERLNQYGASMIQAARNHPQGIGAVSERDALTGNLTFSGFERLPQMEEMLVLDGTVELLMRHDLCFREMGFLVFPSQINVTMKPPTEAHPHTEVAYRFSGSIETIYASLVVRLSYTDYFRREDQWKYAVEFSCKGIRLGISMKQIEEGTGELEIYFHPGISNFDRVTFIRFVTDHLCSKGIDIQEQIRLYCPTCSREVLNREAIEVRIQDGKLDIPCQFCETAIVIPKSVEEIYLRHPSLSKKQQQLTRTVKERTEVEVTQLKDDQSHYSGHEDHRIHILHLSDLHLGDIAQASVYRMQLETDLIQELNIRRLEYMVISGDIANQSTKEEYDAAFMMVDGLVKRFGLDASRVVVVPGNHDLNWDLSESAYPFIPKRKLPSPLPEDLYIPAGDLGSLLREDTLYRERFAYFNAHFYRRVYGGQDYPSAFAEQVLFFERPEDRILFLGLNSCWQLDHYFRDRANINMQALTRSLDRLQEGHYDGWLKIAVWHHPVTGQHQMNDEFMQLLSVHGFQVCLHGHIHETIQGFYKYDDQRHINIVGAGTFGAPAKEQKTGIPLQYNLLTFDPENGEMTVNTRRKEKPDGAWSADARWGDKKNPKPWYQFAVEHYKNERQVK
jgi:WD40 repeat protein/GTPase SAR1 family protein/predicted MPP superfamily phosphohydrolase